MPRRLYSLLSRAVPNRARIMRLQFARSLRMLAERGVFMLAGVDAAMQRARIMTGAVGAFTLTGQAAQLVRQKVLDAGAGAFAMVGQAAGSVLGFGVTAATGAFDLVGQAAGSVRQYAVEAGAGAFTLAGQAAGLVRSLFVTAASGAFTLTGQAAGLAPTRKIIADAGSIALTGVAARFQRIAVAGTGVFTLTGMSVGSSLIDILGSLGLTTNLRLCLDAGDSASYTSGQKWLDRSGGGFDFFLGSDGSAGTNDPTFNGTPGDLSNAEYFSFDGGDYLTYDAANETWMNNLHKNNAQSAGFAWVYITSSGGNKTIFGTNGGAPGANIGVHFIVGSTMNLAFRSTNTSLPNSLSRDWAASIPTNQWVFIAYSHNEGGGAGQSFLYFNGATDTFDGAVPSPSASNATYTMQVGARGNNDGAAASGTRIGMLGIWEGGNLTVSQFNQIRAMTRGRFGV